MKKQLTKLTAGLLFAGIMGTAVAANDVSKAIVVLMPTQGNNVSGIVTFTQTAGGIQVVADVNGLKPGEHGFHVHEFGDCSAPDGASAGGHFNPEHKDHGAPGDTDRHVGDLGNIIVNADG